MLYGEYDIVCYNPATKYRIDANHAKNKKLNNPIACIDRISLTRFACAGFLSEVMICFSSGNCWYFKDSVPDC